MEMRPLRVFLTVATEKSFSRAAEKLLRTQPAISLSIQRLETEQGELENGLAEMRDKSAGRLTIGANESSTLYLLDHIERYRRQYPRIKVQIRRSLSSKIPAELMDGDLELGILTYDPEDERLISKVIYNDHLAFVVSPKHELAARSEVSIVELGTENFIAHNVVSPYRAVVLREFQRHKVPLRMDLEMPTIEAIRKMVQRDEGVAFLPRMCVDEEIRLGVLREVKVKEMDVERKIRLVYPARRVLSHAARAFLEVVGGSFDVGSSQA